jgi:hypothetical protein
VIKASAFLGQFQQAMAPRAEPSLTVLVLLELVAVFVALPLEDLGLWPFAARVILTIALFLIALVVVSQHRTSLVITVVAFTLAMISAIGRPHWRPTRIVYADIVAQFCLVAVLSWVVGRALFAPGRVTYHRIQGAIAVYLQLALLFQFAYLLVVVQSPNAFSPAIVLIESNSASKLLYFSLVTLTTTGYGDLVAIHPIARSLANLEAVVGQLFPAILLARLVTLELEHRRR